MYISARYHIFGDYFTNTASLTLYQLTVIRVHVGKFKNN